MSEWAIDATILLYFRYIFYSYYILSCENLTLKTFLWILYKLKLFNSLLSWSSLCYAIGILQIYCKFSKLNFLTESFEMKRQIIRNCTSTQMCVYICIVILKKIIVCILAPFHLLNDKTVVRLLLLYTLNCNSFPTCLIKFLKPFLLQLCMSSKPPDHTDIFDAGCIPGAMWENCPEILRENLQIVCRYLKKLCIMMEKIMHP